MSLNSFFNLPLDLLLLVRCDYEQTSKILHVYKGNEYDVKENALKKYKAVCKRKHCMIHPVCRFCFY